MKVITNTHLKRHDLSMAGYKLLYPDSEMWSDGTRKLMSLKSPMNDNAVRVKIATKLRGKPKSVEHKTMLSIAIRNYWAILSEGKRKQFREKCRGRVAWNIGVPLSESAKRNLSIKRSGRKVPPEEKARQFAATLRGCNHPMYGKIPSPKTCRGKGGYYTNWLGATYYLRSSYEFVFARYLDKNRRNWRYEETAYELPVLGKTFRPDFFIYNNISELECIVELKNFIKNNMTKEDAFRKAYLEIPMVVLDGEAMTLYGIRV